MSALDLGVASCSTESLKANCPDMTIDQCSIVTNFMGGMYKKYKKLLVKSRVRAKKSLEDCKWIGSSKTEVVASGKVLSFRPIGPN